MPLCYSTGSVPASARRVAAALGCTAALLAPLRAGGQIAVLGNTVEEHIASAGQRYEGTIVIRNLTTTAQPVRVYQTDYGFSADGTSRFDSAGTSPRSNARWVKPSASSVTVPPSTDVTITYTVDVPATDSLRGTYWSAIMVEGAPTAPPATGARQVGLGAVVRYAVQLATHLPATGSRKVRLVKDAFVTDSTGGHLLDVVVQNAGDRAYRPALWVELYDAAGVLRARQQQQRGLLYPGCSLKQRFSFASVGSGTYKAVVFADTGDDTVSAAQYKLTF